MPEKVPGSAIKFYEDRFVNLWRFADEQLAKTHYLPGDEITAADLDRGPGSSLMSITDVAIVEPPEEGQR
jgi:glutathione S-transferase